ncbi:MAG: copper chaperone PCu(A)C [Parvibaculum sp.]|nr:copper chaperone PCu(A)C [Parvibaculum sp.]
MRFTPAHLRPALVSGFLAGGLLFAVLVAGFPGMAPKAQAAAGDVEVSDAWVRPSAAKTGAAYLTLTNHSGNADALTGATSPAAAKVQVHSMEMDGTIMRMRRLDELPLPVGTPVALAPGGLHIMLIGLTRPLKAGDTVELHLSFENAGSLDVRLPVQSLSPAAKAKSDMHDMHATPGADNHP